MSALALDGSVLTAFSSPHFKAGANRVLLSLDMRADKDDVELAVAVNHVV